MNLPQILMLRFPEINLIKDVEMKDTGKGPFISKWSLEGIDMPSPEDLDKWEEEYDLQFRQMQAVGQRKYPNIGDQLDMLYHDHMNNTSKWIDTIKSVKLASPKPNE